MSIINVKAKYTDRTVTLDTYGQPEGYAKFQVNNERHERRIEQFAFIHKDELLDALAQIGWLPETYRKPEPLDPREAKIQEVSLALANSDRQADGMSDLADYEALENERYTDETAYRNNAEALIDAGLVKIDE
jgi:hypothetical protein